MKSLAPIFILALTAGILGGLLAVTAHYTKPLIEQNRSAAAAAELEELRELIRSRIEDLELTGRQLESCEYQIEITKDTTNGYGGNMEIAMAFLGGSLVSVRVLSHRETPGFADALDPDEWISVFGTKPLSGIDTVSRATITTRAVLETVKQRVANQVESLQLCLLDV